MPLGEEASKYKYDRLVQTLLSAKRFASEETNQVVREDVFACTAQGGAKLGLLILVCFRGSEFPNATFQAGICWCLGMQESIKLNQVHTLTDAYLSDNQR